MILLRSLAFGAALLALQGCALPFAVPPALSYAIGVAGTAYTIAGYVNDVLLIESDLICWVWGGVWKRPAVEGASGDLAVIRDEVAAYCSGDPVIGTTVPATLEDLWGKVQQLREASA